MANFTLTDLQTELGVETPRYAYFSIDEADEAISTQLSVNPQAEAIWNGFNDGEKADRMIGITDYIHNFTFKGNKVDPNQPLLFPRANLVAVPGNDPLPPEETFQKIASIAILWLGEIIVDRTAAIIDSGHVPDRAIQHLDEIVLASGLKIHWKSNDEIIYENRAFNGNQTILDFINPLLQEPIVLTPVVPPDPSDKTSSEAFTLGTGGGGFNFGE